MLGVLLRRLTTSGTRRGLAGSRTWMIVAILAGGWRALRHLSRSDQEVLYRTAIKTGDVFEIVTRPPEK